uniref:Uncharacterized protein n=1 Tax=Oryza glaberrima TaxID=4538 RepID=I1R463_ORYGL
MSGVVAGRGVTRSRRAGAATDEEKETITESRASFWEMKRCRRYAVSNCRSNHVRDSSSPLSWAVSNKYTAMGLILGQTKEEGVPGFGLRGCPCGEFIGVTRYFRIWAGFLGTPLGPIGLRPLRHSTTETKRKNQI